RWSTRSLHLLVLLLHRLELLLVPLLLLLEREQWRVAAGPVGREQARARVVVSPAGGGAADDGALVFARQRVGRVRERIGGGEDVEQERPPQARLVAER